MNRRAALMLLVLLTLAGGPSTVGGAQFVTTPLLFCGLGRLDCATYSPDGKHILTGGAVGAFLWEVDTGRVVRWFLDPWGAECVAFSADGTMIVTGCIDSTAKLWNTSDGTLLRTFIGHTWWINSVAFSPDGTKVLTGSEDYTAKLWNASDGTLLRTFTGHTWPINSVAFSPDGTKVLTGCADYTMKLWNASDGTVLRTFPRLDGPPHSVAFSPDGTKVLVGAGQAPQLWNASDGTLIRTYSGHTRFVYTAAFSPDGTKLISGSDDKTVMLWSVADGTLLRTFSGHNEGVFSVAFSPDGRKVLAASRNSRPDYSGEAKLWNASDGTLLRTFYGHIEDVMALAFSPDGTTLLTGGFSGKLWNAMDGTLLRALSGDLNGDSSVAFSPDGTKVLTGNWDCTAKLWNVADGTFLTSFSSHIKTVSSVAFSLDGARVLTGSYDGTAKLWNAMDGQLIRTFPGSSYHTVHSVAFSPDGTKILTGGTEDAAKLWNASDGTLLRTFPGHNSFVSSVAFSPDGTKVLTGCGDYPYTAKLWNASDGSLLRTFSGHTGGLRSVAFSPDGAKVLTGGADNSAILWNAADGAGLGVFYGHYYDVTSVAFSPDGTKLATGSEDGTARLWSVFNLPSVSFLAASSIVAENAPAATIQVRLSPATTSSVTVTYSVGGSATPGEDYVPPSGMLVFNPGETAKNVVVPIIDDRQEEPDETVVLTLTTSTLATFGTPSSHVLTIRDNDESAGFARTASSVLESVGTAYVQVKLTAAMAVPVTVTYRLEGGATPGVDYIEPSGSLRFNPGETAKYIAISIINDLLDEPNETLGLRLTGATGLEVGPQNLHVLTIIDDDRYVNFLDGDSTLPESMGPFNISMVMLKPSPFPITVTYSVGGTATPGVDYEALDGTLTFNPGEMAKSIGVAFIDDLWDEPDETLVLTLTGATRAALGEHSTITVTIADDDYGVSFTDAASTVTESVGTAYVRVELSEAAGRVFTVPYSVGGTATSGMDYGALTGTLSFAPGERVKQFALGIVNDAVREPDETVVLTLPATTGQRWHVLTIRDDDPPSTQPNLTLFDCDASPTAPLPLRPGEPLTVSAKIQNNGNGPAGPFWLEFWGSRTGGLTPDQFLITSEWFPGLGAQTMLPVRVSKALESIPDGTYTMFLEVDRPGDVPESNEYDNRGVVSGKRLLALRPAVNADLAVEGFSVSPFPPLSGQPITLSGRVRNLGSEPTGRFWIEFWLCPEWWHYPQPQRFLCDSIPIENLPPGGTVDLANYPRTAYPQPSWAAVAICFADRPDQLNEFDETNNYQVYPPPVAPPVLPEPDLTITYCDFDTLGKPVVAPGDPVRITIMVQNQGAVATGSFWVEFFGSRLGGMTLDAQVISVSEHPAGLGPGQEWTFSGMKQVASVPDGPYTMVAAVDEERLNQIPEWNERNNRYAVAGKRLVVLRPPTNANLLVERFCAPEPLRAGQLARFGGFVRNNGSGDSGGFWIEFWAAQPPVGQPALRFMLCDSIFVPNLPPGGVMDLADYPRTVYPDCPIGNYALGCFPDRFDHVNETDETDNCQFLPNRLILR